MIRIERGEDINALRGMIEAGLISQDDLSKMTITGGLVSSRPQQFQGSRNGDAMQGQQQAKQPARKLRVIGYGNGQVTDLGEEDWKAPPLDYTRGGIEIAGVGKGHYSADGRAAYVQTPQGMTKVILGYDADASDRRNDAALKRERARAEIEQTRESIAASQAQRTTGRIQQPVWSESLQAWVMPPSAQNPSGGILEPSGGVGPGLPQAALNKRYGDPEKGFRWTQNGTLEPVPGGAQQEQAQVTLEKGERAVSLIDKMIGQRDAQGNLVGDAKPHEGFEAAVGAGFGKTFGAQSDYFPFATAGRDFRKMLEQSKGGAFLEAFETLKGGGQITEVEGKKATAAITRMDAAQTEAEFVQAAMEFREILNRGVERARGKLGQGGAAKPSGVAKKSGVDEARLLFDARKAIQNGKDPEAVRQRLRELGVDKEP